MERLSKLANEKGYVLDKRGARYYLTAHATFTLRSGVTASKVERFASLKEVERFLLRR